MDDHFLTVNRSRAPKKKLRGRKRYLRKLLAKAQTRELEVNESAWYDHWHSHPDWYGYGNLSWRMRAAHLQALAYMFRRFAEQLARSPKPYQLFMYLDTDDSSNDAVFVHTENPNKDNFPVIFDEAQWDIPIMSEYFAAMLPGNTFRAGTTKWQGTDIYFIYSPDIGVPIEEQNKRDT